MTRRKTSTNGSEGDNQSADLELSYPMEVPHEAEAPPPDPYSLEDLSVSEEELAELAGEAVAEVAFGKPGKFEYFRAHPDWRFACRIHEVQEKGQFDKENFIVAANVKLDPGDVRLTMLRLVVTAIGEVRLVPTYPSSDNGYHRSMIAILRMAETRWIRATIDKAGGKYEPREAADQTAMGVDGEPVWPAELERGAEGQRELISRAFGSYGVITSPDHPALRKLRGEIL
jgi:hypothetical protein